ncbi:MAG: AraC family transcriptional regulator [Clostridia bacterium]|nr:AraC family transcriptional regulator [Clostridia bacterium]
MKNGLADLFYPLTAQPFFASPEYRELSPCAALRPYIRCFWGTETFASPVDTGERKHGLVTPDTCMDVILSVNFTKGAMGDIFCGINDQSFSSFSAPCPDRTCTFAIRFYAWSVGLFSDEDMRHSLNYHGESGEYFANLKRELSWLLMDTRTLEERSAVAEKYLLARMRPDRENADLMNALYAMIHSCGRAKMEEIASSLAVSNRQLERIFKAGVGVSPKKMKDLIRYQLLWQEMNRGKIRAMADAAAKYGYFDQAHLINDFKKYHTMNPTDAMKFALKK